MAQQPRHTITIRRIDEIPSHVPGAGRLGRYFRFDSRALAYMHVMSGRVPASVAHRREIPILDQGDYGTCTGNAITGALGSAPLFESLKTGQRGQLGEPLARQFYSAAEDIDGDGPFPPNDNGSTGPSVAQAAKNAGFLAGYRHLFDLAAMIDALQDVPVIIGVSWYTGMDSPDSKTGVVTIGKGDTVRGGHEVVVREVDLAAELFTADNSWGKGWGLAGSFKIPFGIMGRLLSEEGDVTVPVPLTSPAPAPAPAPPAPPPTPAVYPADLDYVRRMDPFAAMHHTGHVAEAVHWYAQWKAARGITGAAEAGEVEPLG